MKSILSKLLIAIILQSCWNCNVDKIEKHVEYNISKQLICKYETKNKKRYGPAIYYDKAGAIVQKVIYKDDLIQESYQYRNGVIVQKIDNLGNTSLLENGIITYTINKYDSSCSYYFKNGLLETFQKFNYQGVYYYNKYDSSTNKLLSSYRELNEYFEEVGDSIIIKPYIKSIVDKIDNYTHLMILYDSKGLVIDTYIQKGMNPRFSLKKQGQMRWTKVICDSLGCYSIPVTYGY